jgi:hypothetical protein
MLLTPTFVGLLLAGAAFWTLIWAAIHKLDEIPYIKEYASTQQVLDWIEENKGLTLVITEGFNFVLHGLGPHGVLLTLGGTVSPHLGRQDKLRNQCVLYRLHAGAPTGRQLVRENQTRHGLVDVRGVGILHQQAAVLVVPFDSVFPVAEEVCCGCGRFLSENLLNSPVPSHFR